MNTLYAVSSTNYKQKLPIILLLRIFIVTLRQETKHKVTINVYIRIPLWWQQEV